MKEHEFSMEYLMKNHLFARAPKTVVRLHPYPYIVIKDALPFELYNRLCETFPSNKLAISISTQKGKNIYSNQRLSANTQEALASTNIHKLWHDFIKVHVSKEFFIETLNLFKPALKRFHPWFLKKYPDFSQIKAGTRFNTTFSQSDMTMDCQICINTPVTADPTSVRLAHIDDAFEFYAGLFYMRDIEDNSTGGDLEIYTKTGRIDNGNPEVKVVDLVHYEANTLAFFLGTKDSIHGVTPRSKTPFTRKFVNLVGHVGNRLWERGAGFEEERVKGIGKYIPPEDEGK